MKLRIEQVAVLGAGTMGSRIAAHLANAGVPCWLLGPEGRFPGMPYVIFPGNVGTAETLVQVIGLLTARA